MKLVIYGLATLTLILLILFAYYFNFIDMKDIATSALALVGTFLGATFAFRLNEVKEYESIHSKRRESLNRAIFILIRQFNAIQQLNLEFQKYPNENNRAFNMPAITPPPYEDLVHNFENLEFILESSEHNLIFELTIEQECFHQTISSLKNRNNFFINEVMPAIAKADINRKSVSPAEIKGILGERIFYGAIQGAKDTAELLEKNNASLPKIIESIVNFSKNSYPKHEFINMQKAA